MEITYDDFRKVDIRVGTGLLLRKNEKMYLSLSQRFLLNIKKTIK